MMPSSSQEEIPPPPPPPPSSQTPTQQTPHIVSTIKLPILKKGEFDYSWGLIEGGSTFGRIQTIQSRGNTNGNGPVSITTDTSGQIKVCLLETAEEIVARRKKDERKAKDHIAYGIATEDHYCYLKDAKKYILKQRLMDSQYQTQKGFHKVLRSVSDRFCLESQVSSGASWYGDLLSKTRVDSLSVDDLYTNLRILKKVSYSLIVFPNLYWSKPKDEKNFIHTPVLSNQSAARNWDHENEKVLQEDWEEKLHMLMQNRKLFGLDKNAWKVECYNCPQDRRRGCWNIGNKDGSRTGQKEDSKALVTVDGEGVDWTNHSEDEDYALMACNSSDSDTEVISCSNKCKESYASLKKLYDAQKEQLSDASIEIKAYSQGLKKVEAQLVAHQQGQLWYEQKIKFMKIDLDDKTDVLTYHKKLLAEAQKEKEDLKAKVEKWHNSSKNLSKLLNTQMSANDKFGLGYGDHRYDGILSYENEVLQSVFMNKKSDIENQPVYDRFAQGMHAVPPPMTGNYMPSGPEIEIDYSQFTYGPKQTQPSESEIDTCVSNISTESSELVTEPVVNESIVESQPKVWSDAPIIEEYESDSEDECVSIPTKQQETPSFANQQVKTPRENVKCQNTHSQKPKVDKKDLGHGFAVRACFVCGSLNHLIRDCDFHEKRMARKADLNNGWNNVKRVNKQNQFVPSAVLTRTGIIPVNTARTSGTKNFSTVRQSVNRKTVLTSTAMKVNTVKPIVNREYLKDLEECMDDGDSKVTKEAKLFDALEHKSVVIEDLGCGAPTLRFGKLHIEEVMGNIGFYASVKFFDQGITFIMSGRDFLVTTKSQVNFGLGEIRMNLTKFKEGIEVIDLTEEVGSSSEEKKEKIKEVLDIKYKELKESKPILEDLDNYVVYKKKLDEILISKERLNKKEFSEEEKVGIIEHGLPKKMSDLGNYVLLVKINGVVEMVALVDTGASVSVLPYSLYKDLWLGDSRPYKTNLTMADNTQAKAMGEVKNVRIQIGYQAYVVNLLILDIPVDPELPMLLGRPLLRTCGAIIDMGRGTLWIDDGVIRHTFFPKPRLKSYVEAFEMEGDDDWLGSFEVGIDEDGNVKYGPVAPSFIDIEDDMERALAMEAYFNPFKNVLVFKKLVDFLGSLPVQLKNLDWGNEGYGTYKKIDGDGDWHARFEIVTPSGRKFNRAFKTKTTTRKLSGKFKIEDTLREMMKLECIYEGDGDVFVDYSWERALPIDNEIYLEWVLEFFSTLYFDKDVDRTNLMNEKCIWFRLCGHEHILTLPEFVVVLGLFTEEEVEHHLFEVYFGKLEVDDK
ncbi:ribonuclease H-like domain-containing protein [Tanacetum coccineum]